MIEAPFWGVLYKLKKMQSNLNKQAKEYNVEANENGEELALLFKLLGL